MIREIASAMDVPPFAVGGTSDVTYNNITARTVEWYSDSIVPFARMLTDEFSHTLGEEVTTDLDILLDGNADTLVSILVKKAGGPYMTVNEARKKDGLPPLSDEDLTKYMRVPVRRLPRDTAPRC